MNPSSTSFMFHESPHQEEFFYVYQSSECFSPHSTLSSLAHLMPAVNDETEDVVRDGKCTCLPDIVAKNVAYSRRSLKVWVERH